MKKVLLVCLLILGVCLVFVAFVNVLYNLAGLFNIQDAADGPKRELTFAALIFLALTVGAFYLCYRVIQRLRTH